MSIPQWRMPEPKIDMVGHVRYRCASCGKHIDGLATFYDPEQDIYIVGALTPATRTYHPECPKEPTDGR